MYGFIYKITNDVNGKFYIGQTINGIETRLKEHIIDATGSKHLDTHFARAIRKYGPDHFHTEELDHADNQKELTQKEYEWIRNTNATVLGYNESLAEYKSGGNTYISKSKDELDLIKKRISYSNSCSRNGNARSIKMKNTVTGEEIHFQSIKEAQIYFNEKHHTQITKRISGRIKSLYKNIWLVAFENDEYGQSNPSIRHKSQYIGPRMIEVQDLTTLITSRYNSYREFERKNNLKYKSVATKVTYHKGDRFVLHGRYIITVLN